MRYLTLPILKANSELLSCENTVSLRMLCSVKARILLIAISALLCVFGDVVFAYEKDTHYGLTYYLARRVGYTRVQAHRIAKAAWSIDVDPDTEPLQMRLQRGKWLVLPGAVKIRHDFHAFPDEVPTERLKRKAPSYNGITDDDAPSKVDAARVMFDYLEGRRKTLLREAMGHGNPGILIHYLQDVYAHTGYDSSTGHFIPDSHAPDFLSNNPELAYAMAKATVDLLGEYMKQKLNRDPCVPDDKELRAAVRRLIDINPVAVSGRPKWDHIAEITINEMLPKDEKIPLFNDDDSESNVTRFHFDNQGRVNFFPNGYGPDDWKVTEEKLIDYVVGESWIDWKEQEPRTVRKKAAGSDNSIELFRWKHKWEGGEYDASTKKWSFSRQPEADEMPTDVPGWVKADPEVKGKLRWHLVLRVKSSCTLEGEFYPGLIKWVEVKDKNSGSSITRKAWVPEGKDGWGTKVIVEYQRYWPRL